MEKDTGDVVIAVKMNSRLAETLHHTVCGADLYQAQKGRFEIIIGNPDDVAKQSSDGHGTLFWVYGRAEAHLFIAYLEARGYKTAWLWDMAKVEQNDNYDSEANAIMVNIPWREYVKQRGL